MLQDLQCRRAGLGRERHGKPVCGIGAEASAVAKDEPDVWIAVTTPLQTSR